MNGEKGVELLTKDGVEEEWNQKRQTMLSDVINVKAFFTWFIENWPISMKIMKETPEYQERFK